MPTPRAGARLHSAGTVRCLVDENVRVSKSREQRRATGSALSVAIALLIVAFLGVAVWAGFDRATREPTTAEVPRR